MTTIYDSNTPQTDRERSVTTDWVPANLPYVLKEVGYVHLLTSRERHYMIFFILVIMTGLVGMIVALSNDYTDDSTYNNLLGSSLLLLIGGCLSSALIIYEVDFRIDVRRNVD